MKQPPVPEGMPRPMGSFPATVRPADSPSAWPPTYYTMGEEPQRESHLRDYLLVLKRQRWWLLGVFLAVVGIGAWVTLRATPIYEAQTTIRIESPESEMPILSELAALQKGNPIATEIETLRSRSLAERVALELALNVHVVEPKGHRSAVVDSVWVTGPVRPGHYLFEHNQGIWSARLLPEHGLSPEGAGRSRPVVASAPVGSPLAIDGLHITPLPPENSGASKLILKVQRIRDGVDAFLSGLQVAAPVKQADVISVTYRHSDPQLAKAAVDAVVSEFIAQSSLANKSGAISTREFIEEQLALLSQELKQREEELQAYKNSAQVVALDEQAQQQIQQYGEFEAERSRFLTERNALVSLMNKLGKSGNDSPGDLSTFPSFIENTAIQQLKVQQNELEALRNKLLTEKTAAHPDVIAVQRQVDQIGENLRAAAEGYRSALDSKISALDQTVGRFKGGLAKLPEKALNLERLLRAKQVKEELYMQLQVKLQEAEIAEAVEVPSIRVIDPAVVPEEPVKPNKRMNLTLALLLGTLLGCGAAFTREYFDNTLRSKERVEEDLRLPVIGVIPLVEENGRLRLAISSEPPFTRGVLFASGKKVLTELPRFSPAVEAFRALCTNLGFLPLDPARNGRRRILVSSAGLDEGKTTVAVNLGICFAQQGISTVLVDADLRRGSLHRHLGLPRRPGLSDYLAGRAPIHEIARSTGVKELSLVSSGSSSSLPVELIGSEKMDRLLEGLFNLGDVVIIDGPPVLPVADALALSSKVDDVLLIIRSGLTDKSAASDAAQLLSGAGANRITCVLNALNYKEAYGHGYYQQYYQEYYTEEDDSERAEREEEREPTDESTGAALARGHVLTRAAPRSEGRMLETVADQSLANDKSAVVRALQREEASDRYRKRRRRKLLAGIGRWLPAILWCGVIAYFTLSPQPGFLQLDGDGAAWTNLAGHFVLFGVLTALVLRAVAGGRLLPRAFLTRATVLLIVGAMLDESAQSGIANRTNSGQDLAADLAGILLVAALWRWRSNRTIAPRIPLSRTG